MSARTLLGNVLVLITVYPADIRSNMSTGVRAHPLGGGPQRKVRTFPTGRVCAQPRCQTVISRYNRADYCFGHAPATYRRLRGVVSEGG